MQFDFFDDDCFGALDVDEDVVRVSEFNEFCFLEFLQFVRRGQLNNWPLFITYQEPEYESTDRDYNN